MWALPRASGVAAKVGISRKLDAHIKQVAFHCRTAATYAQVAKARSRCSSTVSKTRPFEHEEHRRCLREWGVAPDPKSLHDGAEDAECTTEVEAEDSFPPPGWGCPGQAVGLDNPPPRQFRRRHSNLSHPPGSSCLHSVLPVAKDPTKDLPPVIVSRKWLKGGGQPSGGEGRRGRGAPLGLKQGY